MKTGQAADSTFKNKQFGAIGMAGFAHGKSRRRLRKKTRREKPVGKCNEGNDS